MGNNSISNNKANDVKIIYSRDDINSLKNLNDKAKSFLNSAFDSLDVKDGNSDGKLNRSEGEIYVFGDGSISVMKGGKLLAGMSAEGSEAQMIGDVLQVKFSDGAESVMKDGKLISGKTSTNRAFKKEGDQIVFEETEKTKKAPEVKTEAKKAEDVPQKRVSTGSIKGVKKEKIDNIVNEYIQISRSIDGKGEDDYEKWVQQREKFTKKYQNIFKKILGEPRTYKDGKISTDVYNLSFSPVLNPRTMAWSWELFDIEEK